MADLKEKDKKELTAADVAKLVTRTARTTKTVKGEGGKSQQQVEEKQVEEKPPRRCADATMVGTWWWPPKGRSAAALPGRKTWASVNSLPA